MVKKLIILALMAFNVFNLNIIQAQVPSGYQTIVFDNFSFSNNNTFASQSDNVNQNLWSFINFRSSYIDVDGITVVSNGEAIQGAEYAFKANGGQHFELEYDNYSIIFTLQTTEVNPPGVNVFPYVVVIRPTGNRITIPTSIEIELSLPDQAFIEQPDATGGFLELLVGYGVFNPVGLLILFFVTLFILNVTLVFINVPTIVYIATNLVVGAGFLAFNFIPVWAGFIFISFMILFFIMSIKGAKL